MYQKPTFIRDPSLHELKPVHNQFYAGISPQGMNVSLEDIIRRATEGVNIVPPAAPTGRSTPRHQTNWSSRGIGFAVFGVVCLLLAGIVCAAISNKPQANTSNPDISFYATPFVPLNIDIVKYLLSQYQYDDGGYGQLTIRSIDWVPFPSVSLSQSEYVCVKYNSLGTRTSNLAQEYTFVWDGSGWRIVATGDRTVNPCR